MIYIIKHITDYIYDDYVSYCHNLATLKPRNINGQSLLEFFLEIEPKPSELSERIDFFGNHATRFSIQEQHKKLRVATQSKVSRDNQYFANHLIDCQSNHVTLETALNNLQSLEPEIIDSKQYTLESPLIRKLSPLFKEYALRSFAQNRPVFESCSELTKRIFTDFEFVTGFTNVATPINEVMEEKKGVCQDFAQVAIACLRSVGLPARYISGYIETIPPAGKEKLVGADASHAWFSLYIPTFGWIDFDPTNNLIPIDQHITIAWGRDYYDVPPLKGVIFSNGKNTMKVSVDIRPDNSNTTGLNTRI